MPTLRSPLRLAVLMAACSVALTACASSSASRPSGPAPAADPVVTTERRTEFVCPAALADVLPDKPVPGEAAVLEGSPEGMAAVSALGRWGDALFAVLAAAKADCARASP